MKDDLVWKQRMYLAVHTLLRKPENEAFWLDNPPFLTGRVVDFETKANELGAFGIQQGQGTTGLTQQKNLAETALEDVAHQLARPFRVFLRVKGRGAEAAHWDLSLTDWRRMHDITLLDKATALHTAILPATQGNPAPGVEFGLTTAKLLTLQDLIDDYGDVIGAPKAARGERKAKTAQLRPRFRVVDGILEDMDAFIIALRGESAAQDLFVDSYFNARRIGGRNVNKPEEAEPQPTP